LSPSKNSIKKVKALDLNSMPAEGEDSIDNLVVKNKEDSTPPPTTNWFMRIKTHKAEKKVI
jgi:hypothetical protein